MARHDRTGTEQFAEFKLYIWRVALATIATILLGATLIAVGYTAAVVINEDPEIIQDLVTWVSELLRPTQTQTLIASTQVVREPTNTYYPTYTNYPTQTFQMEPVWIWLRLSNYGLNIEVPSSWALLPINSHHNPDKLDQTYSDVCEDYLLIAPDGKQIITIKMVCEFGEGIPGECPPETVMIEQLGEGYLYRYPKLSDNSYYYSVARYGDANGSDPGGIGYVCYNEWPVPFQYQYIGKSLDDIDDFTIIDRIARSALFP